MTPDRLQQIEDLYHSVREASPEARAALLEQADPELRREVESLLRRQNDRVILDRSTLLPGDPTMTIVGGLTTGARLGPYRVESKLGEGGMGEVFRAVDTRLGRAVAIKIAHERFSTRFEREARAISSFNHPNICTLYDIGPNYLVMELVEGETIAAKLKTGPLPVKTALLYASQIAAALVEAHGKGVIHRDLKPGNIMIAKSGVKVLDFGLAKSEQDETVTVSQMVLGTPAYMAPEQRAGKPADARTDIYSFGCVLYEMLTGGRVGAQRKRIASRRLGMIVDRCLEEDPERRWQSAAELERELTSVAGSTALWKIPAIAATVLAVAAGAYFYFHRAPKLTDKDTIVLADFNNKTGDPVFDDTLRQGLSIELQQSPFLSLISDQQIQGTLALMKQPKDARLTSEVAQQICERTGSAAVLEGSIASLGNQYVLALRARNCNTGAVLDQEQIQVGRREEVLNSLSQIARAFRTKVGESLATVEKHSTLLAEATTSSLEALRAYSASLPGKVVASSGDGGAIPFLQRAIEIDPKFAMAHAALGVVYNSNGEYVLGAESTKRAWELRDRVSDNEKFFIDFTYSRQVTGNLEKAYQILEAWNQTYPRSGPPNARGLLAGLATHGTGRYERAIEASKGTLAEGVSAPVVYVNLAGSYFLTSRLAEAESALQSASERRLEAPDLLVIGFNLAALKGDHVQMDQAIARARGKSRAEHWMAHEEALALARTGRLQSARRSSSRAMDLALQEGAREEAANYQAARAYWEAAYGNAAEGRRNAMASLDLSKGRDVEYVAGLAFGLTGDSSRLRPLADDLEKLFPEDTFAKFTYVPVLRGLAGLGHGKPEDVVEGLQMALRYELASTGLNFNHYYLGGLHGAYILGQALRSARRYGEAAAEFQKILDHPGLVGLDPIGALAHLQLGRNFALSGDNTKARTTYQDFLTLWKDADPDVPVLKQAKVEYAKLR